MMSILIVMRYGPRLSRPPDGRRYIRKVDQGLGLTAAVAAARIARARGGLVWIEAPEQPAHRRIESAAPKA